MQISSILPSYTGINKTQSFQGLWGRTSVNPPDIDPVLGIKTHYETCYYYPFADESEDEIKDVVSKNSLAFVDDTVKPNTYVIKECKVCTTLPFKKVNFDNYYAATAKDVTYTSNNRKIHALVKDKYTNNNDEQIPAINTLFNKFTERKIDIKG